MTHACMFIDIKDVFYNMIRERICRLDELRSDQQIVNLVQSLGLSQDIIPKLCKMLDSEAIINQRTIDAHLSQITSAFTNQTWFMTQGMEKT